MMTRGTYAINIARFNETPRRSTRDGRNERECMFLMIIDNIGTQICNNISDTIPLLFECTY